MSRIKITFMAEEEDREYLRILSAKVRCSQGELLLKLLYEYGETLLRVTKEEERLKSNGFTPESGLPEAPKYNLCWLTDGEWLSRSAWFTQEELAEEQVKAYDASAGNLWWVQSEKEPDLPKAYSFQHLKRNQEPDNQAGDYRQG